MKHKKSDIMERITVGAQTRRRPDTDCISATDMIKSSIEPNADPQNWTGPEPGEDSYSSNQMIEAFKQGVDRGREQRFTEMLNDLIQMIKATAEANAQQAAEDTWIVLRALEDRGCNPVRALLKELAFNEMRVLIFLPENEYVSAEFLETYKEVVCLEQGFQKPTYQIQFSFTADSEALDPDLLRVDGYIRSHTYLEANES
ncbi:MAG: hypothetical protein M5R41_08795 [Bacteroidia bacterium]|nr:hypothetical protein [Bacteroidia bacterium]